MRIRLAPREGWSTVILLMLLFLSVTWSVHAAGWASGLNLLDPIVVSAVLIGMILAKIRRLPGVVSHIFGTVVGCALVLFVVSSLLPDYLPTGVRMASALARLQTWMDKAIGEGMSSDNLVFVLELGMLVWVLAYLGSWFTFRTNRIMAAIIPGGIALLINLYYGPSWLFAFSFLFLITALLLVVRSNVFAQQQRWERGRILFHPDIGWDFLRDGAILAACIVLVAWALPAAGSSPRLAVVWARLAEPWEGVQVQWNRMFTSLNYEKSPHPGLFGATMSLGGGVNLSQETVLEVRAGEPRYWRASLYDSYTGRGWVNSDTDAANWNASTYWPVESYRLTTELTQTIKAMGGAEGVMYAAGEPIWSDVGTRATLSYSQIEGIVGGRTWDAHVSVVRSKPRVASGQSYTIVSEVSYADIASLRSADVTYPTWVKNRYLGLPESLPARVVTLAKRITDRTHNPYDAAEAIQNYLRREMRYSLAIDPPPAGVDAVDYFLFESKVGYCDYYASAMVVLARAAGIPARLASGYTAGKWDPDKNVWEVRQFNAHSWPEVFFPAYGWAVFEPTASEPTIARATVGSAPTPPPLDLSAGGDDLAARLRRERMFPEDDIGPGPALSATTRGPLGPAVAIGIADVALAALLVYYFRRRMIFTRMPPAGRAYDLMVRRVRWLGLKPQLQQTPYEFALEVARRVPGGAAEAQVIADAFTYERFAGKGPAEERGELLNKASRALRLQFLKQWWASQRGRFAPKEEPTDRPVRNRRAQG